MDLRHYVHVVRRNASLIVLIIVSAIGVAAWQHAGQPSVYQAEARVLLRPENLTTDPSAIGSNARLDALRFATVEVAVIDSPAVARQAADALPGTTTGEVLLATSASLDEAGAIMSVEATAREPERAALIANAVVDAYVEQRRVAQVGAIERVTSELQSRLDALGERLDALEASGAGTANVDLLALRDQYAALFARREDLLVQSSLQRPTAEVLSAAVAPTEPIGLGLPAKVVLAALLGGVVGLAVAFAREELDDRVRTRDEIKDLTDVPVLAELPVDRKSARSEIHLATVDDPLGGFAESVRSLRTSIGFLAFDRPDGIRRLLVTSTVAGDGKTLVTANLAAAYAQAGHRTVLVSADLRRPRLEELFGREPGIGAGLVGAFAQEGPRRNGNRAEVREALESAIVPTRVADLWLLPAGPPVPNPAELLSSARMDEVLAELSARFDMVVVDTSPLLPVTDAAALAPKVGHVLVVAGMQGTRRRALSRAAEMIHAARAEVVGLVLNKVSGETAGYRAGGYGARISNRQEALEDVPASRV